MSKEPTENEEQEEPNLLKLFRTACVVTKYFSEAGIQAAEYLDPELIKQGGTKRVKETTHSVEHERSNQSGETDTPAKEKT
jgi:hypothetical protein